MTIQKIPDSESAGLAQSALPDEALPEPAVDLRKGGYGAVLTLAYPIVLTMVSVNLMQAADTKMVGELGTTELAGVALAGSLMFGLTSFFFGMASGVNAFVSQSYGAKRYKDCGKMAWQGIYLALTTLVVILPIYVFAEDIIDKTAKSASVRTQAVAYLRIAVFHSFFLIIYVTVSTFLRGIGNTKTPMYINAVISVTNVVANYALIFGKFGFPRLEVRGAAAATVFASALGVYIYFRIYLSKKYAAKYGTREQWRPIPKEMLRVLKVSAPIGIRSFLESASFTIFTVFIIAKLGERQLAANSISFTVISLSFMPGFGISRAASILVGQNIGADDYDAAVRSGYTAMKLCAGFMALMGVVFFVFPEKLIGFFIEDEETIGIGCNLIRLGALFQLFDGIGMTSSGCLEGAGDTRWPMYITISMAWLLFIPLSYTLAVPAGFDALGAWMGATTYIILLSMMLFLRFKGGNWKKVRI